MLCVMHAQMPCHIKWRVKLELANKKKTKYTEILQKKRWVKPKQKAAPNQSQQYFSGLFQLACRWLHTKSEIARLTLRAIASKWERDRANWLWLWWHTKNFSYVPKFLLIWQHVLPVFFARLFASHRLDFFTLYLSFIRAANARSVLVRIPLHPPPITSHLLRCSPRLAALCRYAKRSVHINFSVWSALICIGIMYLASMA